MTRTPRTAVYEKPNTRSVKAAKAAEAAAAFTAVNTANTSPSTVPATNPHSGVLSSSTNPVPETVTKLSKMRLASKSIANKAIAEILPTRASVRSPATTTIATATTKVARDLRADRRTKATTTDTISTDATTADAISTEATAIDATATKRTSTDVQPNFSQNNQDPPQGPVAPSSPSSPILVTVAEAVMALPSSASSATSLAAAGHSQDHIAKNANVPMAVSVTDALKSVKATRRSRPQSKKATSIAGITTSSTRSGLKSIASTIGGSNSSGSGSGSSTPNISTPQTTTRSVNPAADATSSTTSIARRSYKKMRLFPQNEAQGRNDDTINDAGSQNPTCSLSAAGSSSTRKTTKAARTVDLKRKGKKRSQEDFDDEQDIVQENANDDKNDSTDPSSSSPTREILRNSAHAVSSSAAPKLRKKATTTAVAKVPKSRKKRAATNSGPDITIPVGPISSTRRKRANSVTTDTTDAMAATTPTGAKWKKKERQSAKGEEKKTSYTPADLRPRGSRVRKLSAKAWATASDNTTDPPKAKKRRLARAAATAKAAAEAEAKAHSSASTEPASSPAHNLNSRFSDQGEPMDEIYNLDQEEKEEEGDLDDDEEYSRNNERNEDENNDDRHDDENDGLGGYGLGVSMTAGQNKVRNSRPQDYYHSQRERRCYRHLYQRNQHWYNHGQYQSGYNNHQGPAPQYSHIGPKELAASAALYTMQFDNWGRADGEELASIPLFASSNYPLLTSSPFYAPTVPYTHPSAENSYQTNHRPRRLAASGLGIARSAPMYGQPKRLFHPTTPHHHGYVTHQGDYSPAATVIVPGQHGENWRVTSIPPRGNTGAMHLPRTHPMRQFEEREEEEVIYFSSSPFPSKYPFGSAYPQSSRPAPIAPTTRETSSREWQQLPPLLDYQQRPQVAHPAPSTRTAITTSGTSRQRQSPYYQQLAERPNYSQQHQWYHQGPYELSSVGDALGITTQCLVTSSVRSIRTSNSSRAPPPLISSMTVLGSARYVRPTSETRGTQGQSGMRPPSLVHGPRRYYGRPLSGQGSTPNYPSPLLDHGLMPRYRPRLISQEPSSQQQQQQHQQEQEQYSSTREHRNTRTRATPAMPVRCLLPIFQPLETDNDNNHK